MAAIKLKKNTKVKFDEFTHSYWMGEKELIGVTSLMKKHGLSADYTGISPEVLAKAANRGTAIHKMLEDYDNGKAVVASCDEHAGILEAYKSLGLPVIASEYLVSDNKIVASMIDKVMDGGAQGMVDLADIKGTSQLHIDALEWQLSIYAFLFELQNPKLKVGKLYAVHCPKTAKVKKVEINRIPSETIMELIQAESEDELFSNMPDVLPEVSDAVEDVTALIADEQQVAQLEAALKIVKAAVDARRETIRSFMVSKNIKELRCPAGMYKLKAGCMRESIDSARLKAEKPEIAKDYIKVSETKPSLSFIFN